MAIASEAGNKGRATGSRCRWTFIDAPARQIYLFDNAGAHRAEAQADRAEGAAEGARALMERMTEQGKKIKDIVQQ